MDATKLFMRMAEVAPINAKALMLGARVQVKGGEWLTVAERVDKIVLLNNRDEDISFSDLGVIVGVEWPSPKSLEPKSLEPKSLGSEEPKSLEPKSLGSEEPKSLGSEEPKSLESKTLGSEESKTLQLDSSAQEESKKEEISQAALDAITKKKRK